MKKFFDRRRRKRLADTMTKHVRAEQAQAYRLDFGSSTGAYPWRTAAVAVALGLDAELALEAGRVASDPTQSDQVRELADAQLRKALVELTRARGDELTRTSASLDRLAAALQDDLAAQREAGLHPADLLLATDPDALVVARSHQDVHGAVAAHAAAEQAVTTLREQLLDALTLFDHIHTMYDWRQRPSDLNEALAYLRGPSHTMPSGCLGAFGIARGEHIYAIKVLINQLRHLEQHVASVGSLVDRLVATRAKQQHVPAVVSELASVVDRTRALTEAHRELDAGESTRRFA